MTLSGSGLALSVLDNVPLTRHQRSSDAVAASLALVRHADRLGFTRYWFTEHHNTPSATSPAPSVLVSAAAASTPRIRVGSGGVMLPNHAPLTVAEQFATLEAVAPGRIDLGIGRSSGGHPVIDALLHPGGPTGGRADFSAELRAVDALLEPEGAVVRSAQGAGLTVTALAAATTRPRLWVLGSGSSSAKLAAELGLPYVFAHHFFERGTEQALEIYRSRFVPSETLARPRVIVTANVVAAESDELAHEAALPVLHQLARIETGQPLPVFDTIEEAARRSVTTAAHLDAIRARWFVGRADDVAARLTAFARHLDIDEILVAPSSGASGTEPAGRPRSRETTLALLAEHVLRRGAGGVDQTPLVA